MENANNDHNVSTCSNGVFTAFDDGHTPLICKLRRHPTRLVVNQQRCQDKFFSVYENSIDEMLADRVYDASVALEGKPWGTYVTMEEAFEEVEKMKMGISILPDPPLVAPEHIVEHEPPATVKKENRSGSGSGSGSGSVAAEEHYHHLLATKVVAQFLLTKVGDAIKADYRKIHGTAVWALSANPNSEVQYHIDYAELVRYETGIIYPPIYAGTVHCSKVEDGEIIGGKFEANLGGLNHYGKLGYKGKKKGVGWEEWLEEDKKKDSGWMSVPYRYRRGIFHDGDFPHLSTRIEKLPENKKRVIIGLNMFGHDCGPSARSAPEHSHAFNRQVKLYQLMAKMEAKKSASAGSQAGEKRGIDINVIKENKALSKLLVLAKREKVKQELRIESEKLDKMILSRLVVGHQGVRVGDFFGKEKGVRDETVHIHINQMIKNGKLNVKAAGGGNGPIVDVEATVVLRQEQR